MENLFTKKVPLFFEIRESQLVLGDSFKMLTKMKPESVDMIFADPPYFLSDDGITCQGGKMVLVNKGSWDKLSGNGTSVEENISLTESASLILWRLFYGQRRMIRRSRHFFDY